MVSPSVLECSFFPFLSLSLSPSLSSDGPYDDKIQVSPLQFVTNWTQSFTMTCFATDVYPLPSYVWDDITCDNGNKGSTCTFTPHSPGNITRATCIVKREKVDGFGNKLASKSVRLNFKCKYTLSVFFFLCLFLTSTLAVLEMRPKDPCWRMSRVLPPRDLYMDGTISSFETDDKSSTCCSSCFYS